MINPENIENKSFLNIFDSVKPLSKEKSNMFPTSFTANVISISSTKTATDVRIHV